MLLKIYPQNPSERKIRQVVDCLRKGGVVIYPTDTIYGLGCDISKPKAVERICQIRGLDPKKANLSFVCHDFSHLSKYTHQFDKHIYKLLNKHLPGPFTFILPASNEVPKLLKSKKKTVGIRVPDNNIARTIVQELGNPILSTSLKIPDDIVEYPTDPELIYEDYKKLVDIVIDGGVGDNQPSTVIDCTKEEWEVIRQGKGVLEV